MSSPFRLELSICLDRAEKACRERRVDAFEELQEHEADGVPMWEELISARVGELGNKPFGPELREIVSERAEGVVLGEAPERFNDGGVDLGGSKGIAGGDVRKADECALGEGDRA